jgi:predicted DNA-binding ribbon-helix-helix protein
MTEYETSLVGRNVTISGRRTSLRLEPELWAALRRIAKAESTTMQDVCTRAAEERQGVGSVTSAVRVFILQYYVERCGGGGGASECGGDSISRNRAAAAEGCEGDDAAALAAC